MPARIARARNWMAVVLLIGLVSSAPAGSTVNPSNQYGYGENVGWVNARGDFTNGVVIGDYVCSGYIYGANIGWIHLGSGAPTNGVRYGNQATNDYGVNHDGHGNLSGCAYGAGIGWVFFETNYGKPRVDLLTGALQGYAYGAHVGWIGFSNTLAYVKTDRMGYRDTDADGIADNYELSHTNTLAAFTAGGDFDKDGVSDREEFAANTDPKNPHDFLRIVDLDLRGGGRTSEVVWASKESRLYYLQKSSSVSNRTVWTDSGLGVQSPDGGSNTLRTFPDSSTTKFYRVRAVRPPP